MAIKLPRIQETTMTWEFGVYLKGYLRYEMPPPVIEHFVTPENEITFNKARAISMGKKGNMLLVFRPNANAPYHQHKDYLKKVKKAIEHIPHLSNYWLGGGCDEKGNHWHYSFDFSMSNQNFTTAASQIFLKVCKSLMDNLTITNLPIPKIDSKSFRLIGESKLSTGEAVALDTYFDNGFRRIRQIHGQEGKKAADRLCTNLLCQLRRSPQLDRYFPDVTGTCILLSRQVIHHSSCHDTVYFYDCQLIIDGYEQFGSCCGKFCSESTVGYKRLKEIAQLISKILNRFGIQDFLLKNGDSSISIDPGYFGMSEKEVDLFIRTLASNDIHPIE